VQGKQLAFSPGRRSAPVGWGEAEAPRAEATRGRRLIAKGYICPFIVSLGCRKIGSASYESGQRRYGNFRINTLGTSLATILVRIGLFHSNISGLRARYIARILLFYFHKNRRRCLPRLFI
jgi:hypothetical protein